MGRRNGSKAFLWFLGSLILLALIVMLAALGPWLTPYSPYGIDLLKTNLPPSWAHPFGTDALGRDLFARVWQGARISLFVGFAAALIDLGLGLILGGLAGFLSGKFDEIFMRILEVLYSIPYVMVVLLLAVILGPGVSSLIVGMTLTGWISMARLVRAEVMRTKSEEFVLAAIALAQGPLRILLRHILPNIVGPVLVALTLTIPQAVFLEAFLAFIGLGVPLPRASLGSLISEGAKESWYAPWQLAIPSSVLCLTLFGFNMLGDSLRDLLDPKRAEPTTRPFKGGRKRKAPEGIPSDSSYTQALLSVKGLCVSYLSQERRVPALRGVDLELYSGEMLALVGESGSGKSTLGKALMGILPEGVAHVTGTCQLKGFRLPMPRLAPLDGLQRPELAMVFQNPLGALNPTMTSGKQVMESLVYAKGVPWKKAKDEALQLLKEVGIPHPERCFQAYPHELSGGMRQRVVLAIMLGLGPSLLIADEPTTALDVTTQARILALLQNLKSRLGLGILFITHNLTLAKGWADKVAVLYAGEVIESGPAAFVLQNPEHPYTTGLLGSIPSLHHDEDDPWERIVPLPGNPPDPRSLPKGCAFSPRCPIARSYCKDEPPPWVTLANGHKSRCFATKEALSRKP